MKDGYIRVAALTPKIKVGDCVYNGEQIKALIKEAYNKDTAVAVFPELCITGYTCNDLFLQDTLIDEVLIWRLNHSRKPATALTFRLPPIDDAIIPNGPGRILAAR